MTETKKKACCFFGHRHIYDKDGSLYNLLVKQVERLIGNGFNEFLFGGYGDFDSLSHRAIKRLKEKYPHIKTAYYQSYYKPKDERMEYISKQYDSVIYPAIEERPKKFAIRYCNEAIIDDSDFCVFYVERSYGGALQAMQYAKRKKKASVNLAEQLRG